MAVRSRSSRPTDASASSGKQAPSTSPSPALPGGRLPLTTSSFAVRQETERPPFTLDDIKRAIPQHCFDRPLWKSFGYLTYDLIVIAILVFLSLFYHQAALKTAAVVGTYFGSSLAPLKPLLAASALATAETPFHWSTFAIPSAGVMSLFGETASAFFSQPFVAALSSLPLAIYCATLTALVVAGTLAQGAVMTGVWVIGHECGHGGFSSHKWVCDTVGFIFHTILFVPYYSWAITHRTHHSNNGNMELDEVHLPAHINALLPTAAHGYLHNDSYPARAADDTFEQNKARFIPATSTFLTELNKTLAEYNFFHRVISVTLTSTLGWFFYLLVNASGRRYQWDSVLPVNHFSPSAPLFKPSERALVIASDVGIIVWLYTLYRLAMASSTAIVMIHFILPYFVTQFWLVIITLLQHTHTALPHYSTASWDYVRGALATVDRCYGPLFNFTLHNINDTHVVHHLFSYLPHYHAKEATNAVRHMLGPYYVRSESEARWFGVFRSLWTAVRECAFVAEDNHPALYVVDEAIRASRSLKGAAATAAATEAVEKSKDAAFAAGAHSHGRDAEKEVYWFRTTHIE